MQYNTKHVHILNPCCHATYTIKLMQCHMKHNPCHPYHLCSCTCMGVWAYSYVGEYVYNCIAIHMCMGAMDA